MIDNNGTIDGLKDASHSRVNSEFCFACLLLDLIYPNFIQFLSRCLWLESIGINVISASENCLKSIISF